MAIEKASSRPLNAEQSARMNILDENMRRLDLVDIHFTDPGKFVKVGVVANQYDPAIDIDLRMQEALDRVAEAFINGTQAEKDEIDRNMVKVLPDPP